MEVEVRLAEIVNLQAGAPASAPLPAAEPARPLAETAGGDEAEALFVELLALDGAASKESMFYEVGVLLAVKCEPSRNCLSVTTREQKL